MGVNPSSYFKFLQTYTDTLPNFRIHSGEDWSGGMKFCRGGDEILSVCPNFSVALSVFQSFRQLRLLVLRLLLLHITFNMHMSQLFFCPSNLKS